MSAREIRSVVEDMMRGIRFNLVQTGATTVEMFEPLSKRIHDLGWHLQLASNGVPDLIFRNQGAGFAPLGGTIVPAGTLQPRGRKY